MDAVVFGKCFGLLHNAPGSKGVVMCSPLGFEELGTRRSWHDLAERISQQGRPTLRFDYDGINNSLGVEEDDNRVDVWIENIIEAVAFLKDTCGVTEIALIGLRFGATLAAMAALQIESLDEIVLIAPVVSGRGYVRELRLVADAWWASASPMTRKEHTAEYVDVIGNRMFAQTLDAFNKIDLRKLPVNLAKRILLLDPGQRPEISRYAEKLNETQLEVKHFTFNGIDNFLRDSVTSIPPVEAFDNICEWLGNGGELSTKNQVVLPNNKFIYQEFKEEAVRFGPNNCLFGILTIPVDPSIRYPTVLLLNTGPNLHVGNGRLSVLLARYLAALGITSLRFDLAGIGESDPIIGRGSALYTLEAIQDVTDAIDLLEQKSIGHGTVAVGLCSGAFLAFHAALSETRITGAIIVNLQRFIWKEGTSLQVGGKRTKRSTKFYLKASLRRATWVRIFKGEGDVLQTLHTLANRPLRKIFANFARDTKTANTGTPNEMVRKWARKLSDEGKQIRFWYSEDDPGLSELEEYFGSSGKLLKSLPHMEVAILRDADHSLNSYAARMQFIAMFEAYLREGFYQDAPIVAPV